MNVYDIAIVGYGPTGMVLAALLGQRGHRVLILERYQGLYNLPRAACFDDETMRTFQKLGITEGIRSGSVVQDDYDWVNADGETLVRLTYDRVAPGGWAAMHMMYQPDIEAELDRLVRSLDTVELRQGVTVAGIEETEAGVVLRGVGANGEEVVETARFCVGADGGNGFCRSEVTTGMDDYGFQENWLVCDFRMKRTVPGLPMFRQICNPDQPQSIVRIGPDNHRFSFMLDADVTGEAVDTEEEVWARVSPYLAPEDADLIRVANYVFRSRVAKRWQTDRVFLAGDAAHEMPPFLGQGMCSGIRDAQNLAWKFDMVLRGLAGESLLRSYQLERDPHVRSITEKAIELGRVQTLRDPEAARARDDRMLALRKAGQSPEKIAFPGLTAGFVDGNGGYFPQAIVSREGWETRFDDIAGPGWCLVLMTPSLEHALQPAHRKALETLDVRLVCLAGPGSSKGVADSLGTYRDWFAGQGCQAALIRPDRYVYGTSISPDGLRELMDRFTSALTLGAAREAAPTLA